MPGQMEKWEDFSPLTHLSLFSSNVCLSTNLALLHCRWLASLQMTLTKNACYFSCLFSDDHNLIFKAMRGQIRFTTAQWSFFSNLCTVRFKCDLVMLSRNKYNFNLIQTYLPFLSVFQLQSIVLDASIKCSFVVWLCSSYRKADTLPNIHFLFISCLFYVPCTSALSK